MECYHKLQSAMLQEGMVKKFSKHFRWHLTHRNSLSTRVLNGIGSLQSYDYLIGVKDRLTSDLSFITLPTLRPRIRASRDLGPRLAEETRGQTTAPVWLHQSSNRRLLTMDSFPPLHKSGMQSAGLYGQPPMQKPKNPCLYPVSASVNLWGIMQELPVFAAC